MNDMKALAHIATVAVLLVACLGVPLATAGTTPVGVAVALTGVGGTDLTSSATVIQDAPSGRYVILINRALHPDVELLARWESFFEGDDVPLIMEDVSCLAVRGDVAGIEMAESLRSRLAENQMSLRVEEGALVMSKADVGRFDVIVMSAEAAERYDVSTALDDPNVVVVGR